MIDIPITTLERVMRIGEIVEFRTRPVVVWLATGNAVYVLTVGKSDPNRRDLAIPESGDQVLLSAGPDNVIRIGMPITLRNRRPVIGRVSKALQISIASAMSRYCESQVHSNKWEAHRRMPRNHGSGQY